jgi:hypothetical protein
MSQPNDGVGPEDGSGKGLVLLIVGIIMTVVGLFVGAMKTFPFNVLISSRTPPPPEIGDWLRILLWALPGIFLGIAGLAILIVSTAIRSNRRRQVQ